MAMLLEELQRLDMDSWCLDGFPRTVQQAQKFDRLMEQVGTSLDLVISMEVDEEEIRRRVHDRWIHPASGRSYSLSFNPPKQAGLDDETGEKLVRRLDDQSSTIEKRLEVYRGLRDPILGYYEQSDRLLRVEGADSASIYARIQAGLPKLARLAALN